MALPRLSLCTVLLAACATAPGLPPTPSPRDTADVTDVAPDVPLVDVPAFADVPPDEHTAPPHDVPPPDVPPPADVTAPAAKHLPAATIPLTLQHGAFPPTPAHPSAVAYVPEGLDPTPPLHVVVYLHGWYNCATNVLAAQDGACQQGGVVRPASHLMAQFEAAHKNALLLVPEVMFDQGSSDPGTLGTKNGFRDLLAEALQQLAPELGPLTLADVGRVMVLSHSGGYLAAGGIASVGGVPVQELVLLDSLYGDLPAFEGWLKADLASLQATPPLRRFADVYTTGAGTLKNSQALADEVKAWLPQAGAALVDDRTTSTWPAATYGHGLLFKLSGLSHHGVTTYYFGQMVGSSGLPVRGF